MIIKTYKYKLYSSKKNKHLNTQTKICGNIYNHCISLKKRYYKMYSVSFNKFKLQKHLTKLKKLDRYSFWSKVGSQSIQDITDRIEKGYTSFFKNCKKKTKVRKVNPPSFKKVRSYSSFTFKQAGFKLLPFNQIKLNKRIYKYHKSREMEGEIKCVTVKRDSIGDWYIYFICNLECNESERSDSKLKSISMTDKTAGFDFGCSTFLTVTSITKNTNENIRKHSKITSPLFFKQSKNKISKANKSLSKKVKGSNNYKKAKLNLARTHKKIKNQRHDFHFKTALDLCKNYDIMFFETLDIKSMMKEHGRKINDLGFSDFLNILKFKAKVYGNTIHCIDKWFASSKICNYCKYKNNDLKKWDKIWICPQCGIKHHRDENASDNILDEGINELKKLRIEEIEELNKKEFKKPVRSLTGGVKSVRLGESQASFV